MLCYVVLCHAMLVCRRCSQERFDRVESDVSVIDITGDWEATALEAGCGVWNETYENRTE